MIGPFVTRPGTDETSAAFSNWEISFAVNETGGGFSTKVTVAFVGGNEAAAPTRMVIRSVSARTVHGGLRGHGWVAGASKSPQFGQRFRLQTRL